jgi:tetratricopeptide (TPR) repeat protein
MKNWAVIVLATLSATVSLSAVAVASSAGGKVVSSKFLSDKDAQTLLDKGVGEALKNKDSLAKKDFSEVLNKSRSKGLKDVAHLELGRVFFQENNLKEALSEYEEVSKYSSVWVKALDEKAWTYLRMGHPEKALAPLKTVLNPIFSERIGSEPYFLQALSELRLCDYPAVFATIKDFKDRMKPKATSLQAQANSGDVKAKAEVKELEETISKLHLVEIEAIQRTFVLDPKAPRQTVSKIEKGRDQLTFPESKEIWLDEIDSYQVQAKGCPAMKGTLAMSTGAKTELSVGKAKSTEHLK